MIAGMPRAALMVATALSLSALGAAPAFAQSPDAQLSSIEKQIHALQAELRAMKQQAAERDRELRQAQQARTYTPPPATQAAPVIPQIPAGYALVPAAPGSTSGSVVLARVEAPPKLPPGTFRVGAVDVQLGGFIDSTAIYRSRNEVTDITSNFNTAIPFRNSQLYHEGEFHETERASRVSVALTANPDEVTKLRAFGAIDFQGAAPTSNSNQSNSFVPRIREAWITYDRSDLGLELLGGQAWSLITMNKIGVDPSQINNPVTVDAGYVPGFNYTRQTAFRVAKSFNNGQFWLAASAENPATLYTNTSVPSSFGTLNVSNPGTGTDGTGSNTVVNDCSSVTTTITNGKPTSTCSTTAATAPGSFTDDLTPDIIVKATADFPLAHLEAYGLGRVFHDRLSQLGTGQSNTVFGGGGGGAALIHIIPKLLDFQVSGLIGTGIGRYGDAQLPDATIGADGKPAPLREYTALAGLIGHPTPKVDLFGYVGTEQVHASYFDAENSGKLTAYGYGNPDYSNVGCETELAPSTEPCTANTSGIVQGTVGGYWKFLKGPYGTMQVGGQYSYTHRAVFQGVGRTPSTDENIVMLSFRYYPFQ